MAPRPQGISRDHHFIPRFHLRGFTPSPGPDRLARFDKTTGLIGRPSVARSAVIKDYHTLPALTGREPTELEDQFTVLETTVAPWIRHLRSVVEPGRMALDAIARDGLAGYLAMLHIRSPVFREPEQRMATFLESIRIDMLLADPIAYAERVREHGPEGTDEEIEAERCVELERFRSGEIFVEAPEQWSLMELRTAIDDIRPVLIEMHWTLVRRDQPPFLILGDQPITLVGPNGELGAIGFASDEVDVLVPLSPSCLLVMSREPNIGGIDVLSGPPKGDGLRLPWWQVANEAAWRASARFVFGRAEADLQSVELGLDPVDRRSTLPGPSYRGGDPAWAGYAQRLGISVIPEDEI